MVKEKLGLFLSLSSGPARWGRLLGSLVSPPQPLCSVGSRSPRFGKGGGSFEENSQVGQTPEVKRNDGVECRQQEWV